MRIVSVLLVAFTCYAQSDQAQVEAVLKNLERAEQTGNFDNYLSLWTREKSTELENMRSYARARPEVRYRAIKTYLRGDEAVILAEGFPGPFETFKLRKQGSQWKIQDEVFRDTAPNPNSAYALLPPEPGAFARAGSPWAQVPPGLSPSESARLGWQMKAAFDDSYLYIRIESTSELPAPGSTVSKPPGGWPVLKIITSDAGEFVLYDAVNVGDQATFDKQGKANSHRAYAAYTIRLERNDQEVFSATADLQPSPLLTVTGRDYDIRIPLLTMGIQNSRATRITVGDAQWPKSVVLSFAAQRYPR